MSGRDDGYEGRSTNPKGSVKQRRRQDRYNPHQMLTNSTLAPESNRHRRAYVHIGQKDRQAHRASVELAGGFLHRGPHARSGPSGERALLRTVEEVFPDGEVAAHDVVDVMLLMGVEGGAV